MTAEQKEEEHKTIPKFLAVSVAQVLVSDALRRLVELIPCAECRRQIMDEMLDTMKIAQASKGLAPDVVRSMVQAQHDGEHPPNEA